MRAEVHEEQPGRRGWRVFPTAQQQQQVGANELAHRRVKGDRGKMAPHVNTRAADQARVGEIATQNRRSKKKKREEYF